MKLVNGLPADALPLADRSIQFGDGVFRTIKLREGQLIFWARHYRKLCADCMALGIAPPAQTELLADIQTLLAPNREQSAAIKIIVTRGESARGYAIPANLAPNRIVQIAPLPAYPAAIYQHGAQIRLCTMRAGWQPALAGIKHLNRLENVLARREWTDPAILEGLLLDHDGYVLEGVMSNVLIKRNGQLLTPCLDGGGVAGVMREVALEAAEQLGWTVAEPNLTLDDLRHAEQVWISNSLLGLAPVAHLEDTHWKVEANSVLMQQITRMAQEETAPE